MFNCTVPGAITAIFAAIHGRFSWSSSQRASCVFLCLKSGYLSFVYNQRFTSIWSAMYSPHPRHKWHHKNRKAALTFSTRILHLPFTYLLQPTTTIPSVQRTWKEFLPSLDLGKTATKREQQDWHQQGHSIDIWTLRGLMFTNLIWSMTLPLRRIHKELLPQFLSCCTDDEEEFFYFTITLDNCSLLLLTIQEHPK